METLQIINTSLGPIALFLFLGFIYLVSRGKVPAKHHAQKAVRDESRAPSAAE